jgi:DNA modification methylase
MLDEQDDSLALVVNPAGYSGSHFATFPPKLVEPMVKASTRTGDTVLDCFSGAGTVGLVADRLQRNAILCELKPEYVDMGSARITNDAPMFADLDIA